MAIAAIFNVPGNEAEFNSWAFAHAAHHRDIIRVMRETYGYVLDEFALDPFDKNNPGAWLYQHQQMHSQMDPLLGIAGYNLLYANFNNRSEFFGWIWLNAIEHYQAANLLGVA